MNPINKPAAPAVGWQQARVLEMQAEYADAFDTQTGSYDEMCAAYAMNVIIMHTPVKNGVMRSTMICVLTVQVTESRNRLS